MFKNTKDFDPHDFNHIKLKIDPICLESKESLPNKIYNNEYQDIMGMYYMGLIGIDQTAEYLDLLKERYGIFVDLIKYYEKCFSIDQKQNNRGF
jgi:hypothetical protein